MQLKNGGINQYFLLDGGSDTHVIDPGSISDIEKHYQIEYQSTPEIFNTADKQKTQREQVKEKLV